MNVTCGDPRGSPEKSPTNWLHACLHHDGNARPFLESHFSNLTAISDPGLL